LQLLYCYYLLIIMMFMQGIEEFHVEQLVIVKCNFILFEESNFGLCLPSIELIDWRCPSLQTWPDGVCSISFSLLNSCLPRRTSYSFQYLPNLINISSKLDYYPQHFLINLPHPGLLLSLQLLLMESWPHWLIPFF
jgi:hypothetical protein